MPRLLPDGRVAWWWSDGRLVDQRGGTVLDLAAVYALATPVAFLPSPDGSEIAVTWMGPSDGPSAQWYWTRFERRPDGSYAPRETLAEPAGTFVSVPYCWLDATRALGPEGVIDFAHAQLQPVRELKDVDGVPDRERFPLMVLGGAG